MAEFEALRGTKSDQSFLAPKESFSIEFKPLEGPIIVWATRGKPPILFLTTNPTGGNSIRPSFEDILRGDNFADPGGLNLPPAVIRGGIRIELFQPGLAQPILSIETKDVDLNSPPEEIKKQSIQFTIPKNLASKTWKCRYTNITTEDSICIGHVEFPNKKVEILTTKIPFRVLNHAARQFLIALGLQIYAHQSFGLISFNKEIEHLTDGAIKNVQLSIPDNPLFSASNLRMDKLTIRVVQNTQFNTPKFVIRTLFLGTVKIANLEVFGFDLSGLILKEIDITLNIDLAGSTPLPDLIGNSIFPFADAVVKIKGEDVGLPEFVDIDDVEDNVKDRIKDFFLDQEARRTIVKFLTEGFMQIAQRGNIFWSISADQNNVIIKHFKRSSPLDGIPFPSDPAVVAVARAFPDLGLPTGRRRINPASSPTASLSSAAASSSPSTILNSSTTPSSVTVSSSPSSILDPLSVQNLSKIKNIVVLMQENRSFDHMLGYLTLRKGRTDVLGLTGKESNFNPKTQKDVQVTALGGTLFSSSPHHDHKNVLKQVADGKMSGFLENFLDRFELAKPSLAMGFYTEEHLPVYDFLASTYTVCDRWFCAHPGPTMPNRIITLTGKTPIIDNFSPSDPRVGYLPDLTIFDFLTAFGVSWAYYEQDIGFLRLFNRYRLDAKNVLPCFNPNSDCKDSESFFSRAAKGTLPQVTFIDPDFVDIPPDRTANDDHPPADIKRGQELIKRIYNALIASPQWKETLFIITYDEHGGFFDHVPPPGTKLSPEGENVIPKVNVNGKAFYGVRVPTFVVSPWVKAEANHTTFDHTSIAKTIVLKFIPELKIPGVLKALGERVQQANHLGGLLSKSQPLLKAQSFQAVPPDATGFIGERERTAAASDFHDVIKLFGIPK